MGSFFPIGAWRGSNVPSQSPLQVNCREGMHSMHACCSLILLISQGTASFFPIISWQGRSTEHFQPITFADKAYVQGPLAWDPWTGCALKSMVTEVCMHRNELLGVAKMELLCCKCLRCKRSGEEEDHITCDFGGIMFNDCFFRCLQCTCVGNYPKNPEPKNMAQKSIMNW